MKRVRRRRHCAGSTVLASRPSTDGNRSTGGWSEATRLKALEEENARLKRLVAEQALDTQILKDLLRKNV
jgi:hypothetical protein